LQNALNPVNLRLSGLSGGLTCYWYFKLKRDGLTAKQQTVKDLTKIRNTLELRITPCILPNPAILFLMSHYRWEQLFLQLFKTISI